METSTNPTPWRRVLAILRPLIIDRMKIRDLADATATIEGIKKTLNFAVLTCGFWFFLSSLPALV